MFNRLQAIRAAIFGISFDFFCLCAGMLIGIIVHHYSSYTDMLIVVGCIGLALFTLCVTWATLKPYIIYGGLHSMVWFVGVAAAFSFHSLLPLAISLCATIILFARMDQIMLFLYNLKRPHIIFESTMPKQSRFAPETSEDIPHYQAGYQAQEASQDDQQTLFYPPSPNFQEGVQVQYPEMRA